MTYHLLIKVYLLNEKYDNSLKIYKDPYQYLGQDLLYTYILNKLCTIFIRFTQPKSLLGIESALEWLVQTPPIVIIMSKSVLDAISNLSFSSYTMSNTICNIKKKYFNIFITSDIKFCFLFGLKVILEL